jgi:two-component system, sensor histidine kinase and response regulator
MIDLMRAPVVMVVDDQEANVRTVGSLLTRAGFDVVPCFSGIEALDRIAVDAPDLVLLDMRMPHMDGFQVLETLRGNDATRALPVIFLTADHERESLVRAFSSGAVDYVTKPFVPEELMARVRTHAELKRARDRFQRLAHERQESLELIAHDLRNHFTNVVFAGELLALGDRSAAQQEKLLESIRSSAHSGLMFLQAVLDQAAGEAQGAALEPLPAPQVAQEAVDAFNEQATGKAMRFDLRLDRNLLVRGQRVVVAHVLHNLISNAVKYAPYGSVITVAAMRHEAAARFVVMDQGPGLSDQDQSQLFRRFTPLSSQATGGEASTGLGLALAKQKARALGGDLWYDPRPGGGACFTLELPRVD